MKAIKYPQDLDRWIAHFVTGELTEEEESALQEWRGFSVENEKLFLKLTSVQHFQREVGKMSAWLCEEGWRRVQQKTARRRKRKYAWRIAVAAMAVLCAGWSGYLLRQSYDARSMADGEADRVQAVRLSRSSGEVFYLDTLKKLTLNQTEMEGDDRGMVVKHRSSTAMEKPEMNMIEVPTGAEYSLVLADGTKVLLNVATTFRFPDNFSGQAAREVYLDGEAYFEVVSDSVHPFMVHLDGATVKVTGTSFNVMAYADADEQQTTLVKGKVTVRENRSGREVALVPGMQAAYRKTSGEMEGRTVDVGYYTAWKDGLFAFREQRLEEVMETLSRWYGFEYFFQNPEARDFIYTGKIIRHQNLQEVLDNFRLTEELDFKVKENTVIIRTIN